jgi:hypothetical protein
VINGGYDVELELAIRRSLEDARIDLDLFDAGPIELFESRDDAGLLACTGGAIDKEMWEVAALCLQLLCEMCMRNL